MSDEDLDPIDVTLGAMFRQERERGGAPADMKARAWSRLATSIGDGGGGSGGGGDAGSTPRSRGFDLARALRIAAIFALGGAAGVVGARATMTPRIVYVDRVAPAASASMVASAVPTVAPTPVEPASAAPASSAEPVPSPGLPRAPDRNRDETLAAERALLDVARTALGRGDGAHALEATERHAREFPRGQMTEEREAIAIQALVKLGRTADARARADRFRKHYPHSVLLVVVDAALGTTE